MEDPVLSKKWHMSGSLVRHFLCDLVAKMENVRFLSRVLNVKFLGNIPLHSNQIFNRFHKVSRRDGGIFSTQKSLKYFSYHLMYGHLFDSASFLLSEYFEISSDLSRTWRGENN